MRGILIALSATQFLLVAWIGRELGAHELSLYALATALFAPITSLLSAGQRTAILTAEIAKNNPEHFISEIKSSIILRSLIIFAFIAASATINAASNKTQLQVDLIILAGLNRALDGSLEIRSWKHQLLNHRREFFLTIIGRILPIAAATIATSLSKETISTYFYSLVATQIIIQFAVRALDNKNAETTPSKIYNNLESIRTVVVVGFAAGIESLLIAGPRFILQSTTSPSEVALYTVATQIAIGFGILASIHLQFSLPKFGKNRTKNEQLEFIRKTYHETAVLWILLFLAGIALTLLPNQFWQLVFGDWLIPSLSLKMALPLLISTWYSSGFLANLINTRINKNWLAITAIITSLVCLGQIMVVGLVFSTTSAAIILWALVSGFLSRLALSALIIRKHLHAS